nr:MAG: putative silencing suppressor protein [Tombusviridae sp.]
MESAEEWVLHPNRCEACHHSTYLRESWCDGGGKVVRRIRHEPKPSVVSIETVQSWPRAHVGGVAASLLPPNRGISYNIRGHGVTITVSGSSNDVLNVLRVANDVVQHPVVQGQICVRHGPATFGRGSADIQEYQMPE